MPKEFDGAIGDKIVGLLEKFENWFDEREKVPVERTIEPETRINSAVHNTKKTIFLTLRKHQNDYGAFTTWDDFAKHMKLRTYDSKEMEGTRCSSLIRNWRWSGGAWTYFF